MIALLLIMQSTDPNSIGPVGILAVFFLLYVISLGCLTWFLRVVSLVIIQLAQPIRTRKPLEALSLRQSYYLSSILAVAPVMLIGMSSVGQLGMNEIILTLLFVIIGVFYIRKRM